MRKERMQRLLSLSRELATDFYRSHAGSNRPVLWEGRRTFDGQSYWHGHTDNYISTFTHSDDDLRNRVIPAKLGGVYHDGVMGTLLGVQA